MKKRFRSGGLAAWSIHHPIGISMLALTVVVVGLFSLDKLGVNLLPNIIYPEIRVNVRDAGVPSRIMEDQVTRQIEEQLAITEGAISVQSTSSEGSTRVSLSFPYGTDIDIALRDASTRLDRAKRFLPNSIEPPTIYKRDPSQIPILELAVSSNNLNAVKLREWVDYDFSRWFINIPGVAAAEVGGGNIREIQIIVDQERLAYFGLTLDAFKQAIRSSNLEAPAGRLNTRSQELSTRIIGRFNTINDIKNLPIKIANNTLADNSKNVIRLKDIAQVIDSHEDERLRIRLNDNAAIKVSIQKQPAANTVEVVDAVNKQLQWLIQKKLIPDGISITPISDQSTFVRYALRNASVAVFSGAVLAMLVVYLFLGSIRRTLIIGSAIPLAILFTFIVMAASGLTLNIMTLGALALGVGLLIDSTIIMLENITRHQQLGEKLDDASLHAAQEINSAIVASTSTNLAAIIPFLFISGLTGLLFSELIFVLSIAILASLVVAITLVPSLGAQIKAQPIASKNAFTQYTQAKVSHSVSNLSNYLSSKLNWVLAKPKSVIYFAIPLLLISIFQLSSAKYKFLPAIDEGQVRAYIKADTGTPFEYFDQNIKKLESLIKTQAEVETVFTTSGGFVFGRSEFKSSNTGSIFIQLKPDANSKQWINKMRRLIAKKKLVGMRVHMRSRGVRGIRTSRGDDDLSMRVQGADIEQLATIGADIVAKLKGIKGLRNISHTYEDAREEIAIEVNRQRAADLAITVDDINQALRIALEGEIISEFLDDDKRFNIRLRLSKNTLSSPDKIESVIVGLVNKTPIRLADVSKVRLMQSPATIKRDRQRRIVEVSGTFTADANVSEINTEVQKRLALMQLPNGYTLYDAGATKTLQQNQQSSYTLIALALFLVFVVMAVQYESLVNPLVIIISMTFTVIGVTFGIWFTELVSWLFQIPFDFSKLSQWLTSIPFKIQTSMPFWLGLIMLVGIVVNNAIVLIEQIEIERENGKAINEAIIKAAQQRLRPILMTTLTTVFGMLPLAIGLGSGSELLQPLAMVIVAGLLFSSMVSLIMVPAMYKLFHPVRT